MAALSEWVMRAAQSITAAGPRTRAVVLNSHEQSTDQFGSGVLPPYTYVPGGRWPHPISGQQGHWAGRRPETPPPIQGERASGSPAFRWGVELFNAGYYWEAHEIWEGLWHAHGRHGPTADLLRALIKLAAAGVKVRERQPNGVITHASRAGAILERLRAERGDHYLGLDLGALVAFARGMTASPPADPGPADAAVTRVFAFEIQP